MVRVRSIRTVAAIALATVFLAACGGPPGPIGAGAVPSVSPSGPALTYVAIGASETLGFGATDPVRQAWTQVFYRSALPRAATMVNLGIPGATAEEALQREAPEAERLRPNVVTVWLNVNDIIRGVPAATYQVELGDLLRALHGSGSPTILVANTPPLGGLPRFMRCEPFAPSVTGGCDTTRRLPPAALDGLVAAYNAAITQAADQVGAIVVDLHALGVTAQRNGTEARLISSDGFHPSTEGHLEIGLAFTRALARRTG